MAQYETQIIQGSAIVPANGNAVININCPNRQCIVEKISFELTALTATVEVQRSDKGTQIVTRGAVAAGLLGAQVINTAQLFYNGPAPFDIDPNCTLSFSVTDTSGNPNTCNVAVHLRLKMTE